MQKVDQHLTTFAATHVGSDPVAHLGILVCEDEVVAPLVAYEVGFHHLIND